MSCRIFLLSFFFLIASGGLSMGQKRILIMESGERLIGEVLDQSTAATLMLRSPLLGDLRLPRDQIERIEKAASGKEADTGGMANNEPQPARSSPAEDPTPKNKFAAEPRRSLLQCLRGVSAPDSWSGNLRMGIKLSRGDSHWTETYLRGKLEVEPEASPHFYRFGGSYTYRETKRNNGESFVSTDRYDGSFIYRRTFFEQWFLQSSLGGRVDNRKGIEREVQGLVGIGYRYEPKEAFELIVGSSGGVEDYRFESGTSRNGLKPVVNIFQELSWDFLERASLVQKFNYYASPSDSEQFNYVFSAAVRYRITDLLGFEFSFNQDLDNGIDSAQSKEDTRWRNAVVVYF